MYIFQMKPQAVSISEDGREYELIVESTVPLPCSSQRCTLPLHLTSSNQGGVKNNIIKKINCILPYIFRPSESYSHYCMCKYDNIYSIFSQQYVFVYFNTIMRNTYIGILGGRFCEIHIFTQTCNIFVIYINYLKYVSEMSISAFF